MRKLGRTGLKVSTLCLGGNQFGWTSDEQTSFAVLDAYVEGGGNFIDTADVYSRWAPGNPGGVSEEIIGRWMAARGNRERVIIATKCGSPMGDDPNESGLSRHRIFTAVEASLRRLQTDYIDLYQAHRDDPDTPLEETMRAFDDLVRQGKVRYLGASNYAAWRLTRALWVSDRYGYARFETMQPLYNLLDRAAYEQEMEPLCRDQEVGVIPYSALASGFLTGKYRSSGALPSSARAGGIQSRYMNERGFALLSAIDRIAAAHSATVAQVALAWLMARPGITAPIAGATSVEQVRDLMAASDLALTADDVAALDQATAAQPPA